MSILEGYASAARRARVSYEFGVEFDRFRIADRRAVAAVTNQGELRAGTFVIALGAWAGVPIVPMRRNVAATGATTLVPESAPMTIWSGDWFHFRSRDGRVLLLWPDDPVEDDEAWLDRVAAMTRERAAPLAALPIAERWSGFYEMTPDGHPLVGRHPTLENVYLAAGSCGHGVMHAPAIGQLVSELLLDRETSIDIRALDPARFAADRARR
jgi:sarcosine oxidase subunit beta